MDTNSKIKALLSSPGAALSLLYSGALCMYCGTLAFFMPWCYIVAAIGAGATLRVLYLSILHGDKTLTAWIVASIVILMAAGELLMRLLRPYFFVMP